MAEAAYGNAIPATTAFATEGTYTLTFQVADKDGGIGTGTVTIEVLNRLPDGTAAALVYLQLKNAPSEQATAVSTTSPSPPMTDRRRLQRRNPEHRSQKQG